MPRSIYKLLSGAGDIAPIDLDELNSWMPWFCLNEWARQRLATELAALLTVEFTPENLTDHILKDLRFTFWDLTPPALQGIENFQRHRLYALKVHLIRPYSGFIDHHHYNERTFDNVVSTIGSIGLLEDGFISGKVMDVQECWTQKKRPAASAVILNVSDNLEATEEHPMTNAIVKMLGAMLPPGYQLQTTYSYSRMDDTIFHSTSIALAAVYGPKVEIVEWAHALQVGFYPDQLDITPEQGYETYGRDSLHQAYTDIWEWLYTKEE